jgi:glutamine amidotransferase
MSTGGRYIAIIDYKAGNTGSVKNALERLGASCVVTDDPAAIRRAAGVILPGQGRAGPAMRQLKAGGLDRLIPRLKQPFLGICLGMQLLADGSEEDGVRCLGVIPGICRRFPPGVKTPQLGWNKVVRLQDSSRIYGLEDGSYFYFVNSYYFDADRAYVAGTTAYGFDFPSAVRKDNYFAVQFHPEKSGPAGRRILKDFCEACGC